MTFGVGEAVAAGIKVLDKFIPDPEARAKAEAELRNNLLQWDRNQVDINIEEARHSDPFVSGWRPALGWTCAFAFAFIYVVGPLITWATTLAGSPVPLPSFNTEALMTLTLGMLGLGGLHTLEKMKGLAR